MVNEARKQSMAWRLEYLGTLRIMDEKTFKEEVPV